MKHEFPRGRFDFDSHVYIVDGAERTVTGNAASLLALLVRNRDRVVTHAEIGSSLAEGEAYVRTYVSTHVNRLRDALGDSSFIRTVPRSGYQWIDDPGPGINGAIGAVGGTEPADTQVQAPHDQGVTVSLRTLGHLLALGGVGILLRGVAHSVGAAIAWTCATLALIGLILFVSNRKRVARPAAWTLANALTRIRPGLGVAAGFEMASGNAAMSLWWYIAGLASDVADGAVARSLDAETSDGREWDAMTDAFMNGAFGLGLGSVALRSAQSSTDIFLLSGFVLVYAGTRSQAHTILDKCLSGVWRVSLFLMGLSFVTGPERRNLVLSGAAIALLFTSYEAVVLANDWRSGARPLLRIRGKAVGRQRDVSDTRKSKEIKIAIGSLEKVVEHSQSGKHRKSP